MIKYENAAILQHRENQHNMITIYINYAKTTWTTVYNEIQEATSTSGAYPREVQRDLYPQKYCSSAVWSRTVWLSQTLAVLRWD